ncbi:TetR family transcriptional regulator [Bacillus cereus]|uniref:TetR/AcrR family transcriptional regulator n=1 Tax=Bacillus nitratireducens TaxID=2026193 RepID=UPI000BECCC41|nr:TetR/AcrR family transcriptional regulator [Bacillus nitratireducens]PEE18490.1 TetR family transcriptional regulator [Bacillus cereus]MED0903453.1 TetR/AcrR family transcriptional regulator [Bacillus nitratireducens]PES74610.1 TetR family transcriptional regulator [Bacillus cereus]PET03918.1 TetR family transcriptional regulator [Bacillus cereus]PFF33697.1 TetR family transcriptional regulator [Bacillus cereus]
MLKKADLRIIRTKKFIYDAFIKLIAEKGYDAITIQDITDEALINRATFYSHYRDKQDLLTTLSENVLGELTSKMVLYTHVQGQQIDFSEFEGILQSIFECILKHADFYKSMLGPHGIHDFNLKMQQTIMDNLEQNFIELKIEDHDLDIPKDMVFHFITSCVVGMAIWWLQNDMKYSPKYTAKQLVKLMTKGPLYAVGFTLFNED